MYPLVVQLPLHMIDAEIISTSACHVI